MLSLENHLQDLNVSDDAYLEEACRQLEESWKSGTPPYFTTLKGYIPPGASQELRRALVIELTLTDIENRYHEDDIVKRYSEMFPELWTADFKDVLLGIYEKHFYLCQEHLHSPPEPIDYLRDVAPDLWPGLLPMLQPAWRFHYSPDSELFVETGMGRLFLARDLEIKRSVMVKELRHPQNPGARDLFDREIAITTELDHPGVIVVYGTRDEEDRKAFAMRLLTNDGRNGAKNGVALTLADKINELHHSDGKSRLTRRDYRILIHVLVSVCETVRFAHSKGIVHRDIKPTNIAVGEYGEVILLDWGLAKRLGISDRVDNVDNPVSGVTIDNTIAGDIKGTAAYMSPEQASGSYDLIDERTDVFNLGATLFHLLTGRSPYTGTPQECLGAALGRTFPRPRSLQPKIPKALEAICLKAMESYEQRYQTVECLKGDLSRWLADERLSTGGEGFREWSGRVLRRYSAAVCVGILSLLVLLLAVVWGNARIGKERDIARQERDRAQKEAAELMFSKGLSLCEQGYPRIGMLRMAEALSELGDASDPLEQTMRTNLATWSQRTPPLVAQFCVEGEDTDRIDGGPAILSDAHRMVTWHADDTFREWDLQSGNLVHKQPFGRPVGKVVPLHGARFAVVNHFDNNPVAEARIWDSQQGRFLGGRMTHAPRYAPKPVIETPSLYVTSPTGSSISSVAISADGTVGVTGTHDGVVTLWSLTDGAVNEVYSDVSDNTAVTNVAITDDGCLFAFVRGHRAHIVGLVPNSGSGLVEIRRVDDPQSESHHLRTSPPARAIEFGRQGQRFAIGSSDGHLLLLDSKTGKTVAQAMLAKGIDQVEFGSSGGRLLVRAGTVVRLYDAETGAYLDTEFRNEKGFESAAFSPDELLVATISGRTVQVWDAVNGKMYTSPFRFEKNVHSVAFADGGKLLVTAFSSEKTVEVRSWDLSVVASEHVIKLPNRLVLDTAFSPDGSRFAVTASEDVFLGRTDDGSLTTQALQHDDSVYALAFTPDGRYLLTGDSEVKTIAQTGIFKSVTRNEGVRRWNTKTKKTEPPVFRTEASDTVY
ncbi:MAG: protein kinase, partial [Sedimentisphaerales bacterium]|nr:protein kinase [Sedimentisphaerales bacterium]